MLCSSSALLLVKGLLSFLFSFLTGSGENFAQTGKPGNAFMCLWAKLVDASYNFKDVPCCFTFFYVTMVTVTLVNSRHFVTSQMVSPPSGVRETTAEIHY